MEFTWLTVIFGTGAGRTHLYFVFSGWFRSLEDNQLK
jgi:hypothetical protein